jgi:hypothetical protein
MNKKARSRKFTAKQSARLGAYFATGVAASVAAPSEADAAIVFFDVNPDQTINPGPSQYVTFGSIDLVNGTYTLNSNTGTYLKFSVASTSWFNFANFNIETAGSGPTPGYDAYKLSLGDPINDAALIQWGPVSGSFGDWYSGGSGYIALRLNAGGGNYNYGWAQLSFVNNGDLTTALTISGFAFENTVNTSINAGDQGGGPAPVPEPGTMAVGAGLFALAVGAHLRRRREKKAAASDALLNLAAGARGVEKLRADKAA